MGQRLVALLQFFVGQHGDVDGEGAQRNASTQHRSTAVSRSGRSWHCPARQARRELAFPDFGRHRADVPVLDQAIRIDEERSRAHRTRRSRWRCGRHRPRRPRCTGCRAGTAIASAASSSSLQLRPDDRHAVLARDGQQRLMFDAAFDAPGAPDVHDPGPAGELARVELPGRIAEHRQLERRRRLSQQRRHHGALVGRMAHADVQDTGERERTPRRAAGNGSIVAPAAESARRDIAAVGSWRER